MPWTTVESAGLSPLLRGVLSWKPPSRGALRPVAKSPVSSLGVIKAWREEGEEALPTHLQAAAEQIQGVNRSHTKPLICSRDQGSA